MNKYTVLVTSALYTNYGIYNTAQRIHQTLETVKSAKKYIPNSTIILIDNSKVDVQADNSEEFNELIDLVDYYIDNSNDLDIQHFHNNVTNYDIGKNAMECLGLYKAVTYMLQTPEILDIINASARVFKLSGRYVLTDKFDITKFDNTATKGKYVFKTAQPSWIPVEDTGVNKLYQTRLWSFAPTQTKEVFHLFETILKNMFVLINLGKYIDVEHSLAKYLSADQIVEVDVIGLQGNIAPNGMVILD